MVLVVVTMLIGSAVGQVTMNQSECSTGESGRATRLLTDAGITEPAQELMLVHSAAATAGANGFRSAVRPVVSGAEATGQVRDMRAPAVSAGRHDVLVQFAVKGNPAIAHPVQTSPGPAGASATYRQTRIVPRRGQESLRINVFEPPSRLAAHEQLGPFQATTSYRLESAAGGTRLTKDVELNPASALLRPIGLLAVPRIKVAMTRNPGAPKELLESARPQPGEP